MAIQERNRESREMPNKTLNSINRSLDLATAIFYPNEENFDVIVKYALPMMQSAKELKPRIIAYDKYLHDEKLDEESKEKLFVYADPVPIFLSSYDIQKGNFARKRIRAWWRDFMSPYLQDPMKLFSILARDPGAKALLSTKEGYEYLKFVCKRAYDFFWKFAWQFPRRHGKLTDGKLVADSCTGSIKYGKVNAGSYSVWGYYCTKCQEVFRNDNVLFANTYLVKFKKQKNK